jgi:DNA-directed RNA polymerase subunit RPC12/RpoP
MRNESFVCENCKKTVPLHPDGSARNHCPFCLYSKHVDENFPGDRAANCHSLMEPIDIDYRKNKGNMIRHRCLTCKKEIPNKIAPDDNFLPFVQRLNSLR